MGHIAYCGKCKKQFIAKTNGKYCSEKCKKQKRNDQYHKKNKTKKCKYCNKEFIGKRNEVLCGNCKNIKIHNFKEINIDLKCRKCNKFIKTVVKKKTKTLSEFDINVCDICKKGNNKKSSQRMKQNNPMKRKEVRAKMASTFMKKEVNIDDYEKIKTPVTRMTPEEFSSFASDKMKGEKNPMKRKDVVAKVKATIKRRVKSGEIVYIRGKNHHLWKGNRDRCQVIRSRLYKAWIRPILERDDFTCCKCGSVGGRLEVHHISPTFQNIVEKILNGRIMDLLSYEEFERVNDQIIEEHKNAIGITYCVSCHKKVDFQRH